MIRVWQSFSCNNSSSYRLVARFADAKTAKDASGELSKFFTEHATQMDKLIDESGEFPEKPTPAALALAKKYGFTWKKYLMWGDDSLVGDEPSVTAEGDVLVVYHTYCGGFGGDVQSYLKARGATVEKEARSAPTVSVLFTLPPKPNKLVNAIKKLLGDDEELAEDEIEVKPPWSKMRSELYGTVAVFSDGKTMGFYLPVYPQELPLLKAWLAKEGVDKPSIRVCEYDDEKKFRAISKARCLACDGALEYLDPRAHGIDKEQLVCKACGGMYELEAFMQPAKAKKK